MRFKGSWTLIGAPVPITEEWTVSKWAGFQEEVKREGREVQRGPRCGLGVLLEESAPEARKVLQDVLDDRKNTHTAIARALRKRLGDEAPGQFTVSNHRRGQCLCSRRTR
jgi:hypothetical protein